MNGIFQATNFHLSFASKSNNSAIGHFDINMVTFAGLAYASRSLKGFDCLCSLNASKLWAHSYHHSFSWLTLSRLIIAQMLIGNHIAAASARNDAKNQSQALRAPLPKKQTYQARQ
jgi:hypothetical protein